MIAPSRDNPSPHDWPEDRENDPDNGAYSHVCGYCQTQFIGHKRRPKACKVCAKERDTEMKRRADILAGAGLNPLHWVLVPALDYDTIREEAVIATLVSRQERTLRRKLAAALKVADYTNSNVLYWGHPGRHRDTSEALLAESDRLDDPQRNLKKRA